MLSRKSTQEYEMALEKATEEMNKGFKAIYGLYNKTIDATIDVYNRDLSHYHKSKDNLQATEYSQGIRETVKNFENMLEEALQTFEERIEAENHENMTAREWFLTIEDEMGLKIFKAIAGDDAQVPQMPAMGPLKWPQLIARALRNVQ